MEFYQKQIRPWIGILALLAIGIMMIAQPGLMEGEVASGRKAFTKTILIAIWGIPVGVILVLIGGFLGYRQIKGGTAEEETAS